MAAKYAADFIKTYEDIRSSGKYILGEEGDGQEVVNQFQCGRCSAVVVATEKCQKQVDIFGGSTEDGSIGIIDVLVCEECEVYVAVLIRGRWRSIWNMLKSTERTGLMKISTFGERIVLWVLNQVVYMQYEASSVLCPFLPTCSSEEGKIFWVDGEAAGFYTVKAKGSEMRQHAHFALPVVDLIYVRPNFRHQGHAQSMLQDIVRCHPEENIGLTALSNAMWFLLKTYLQCHPESRNYFWAVTWTGEEGYRQNIWFSLKRKLSELNMEK